MWKFEWKGQCAAYVRQTLVHCMWDRCNEEGGRKLRVRCFFQQSFCHSVGSRHQTPDFLSVDGMLTTEEEQGSFLWRETWTTKLCFRIFPDSCGATDFCGFPLIGYFGIWCLTVYLCIFSVYMLWMNMTACFVNSLFQRGFNFVLIYYYLRLFIDMVVLLMTKKFLLSFFY